MAGDVILAERCGAVQRAVAAARWSRTAACLYQTSSHHATCWTQIKRLEICILTCGQIGVNLGVNVMSLKLITHCHWHIGAASRAESTSREFYGSDPVLDPSTLGL